ncbi:ABC transporter permease [Ruminiclostridium josui]|uniref:ABC transporter permease n=1 Tax=Ruminiclostridium josui TaxID=1499 RepID=UPI000467CBCF|nr:ABC transporter permease [Ruminiclostridium josui]
MKKSRAKFNLTRFRSIVRKELIQIKRDSISLRIAIVMPIMMMLLFGYAVKTDVDQIPTAVFDQSMTPESREYMDKFITSNYFEVDYYVSSEKELSDLMDSGKIKAGIVIPADYAKSLKKNEIAQTQLIIDGSDPTVARTALNSGLLVSEMYSKKLKEDGLEKIGSYISSLGGITINSKVWYNPNLESKNFTIPGQLGLILQNLTIMLTAFALVREKEKGTIEQLIVTPIKSFELILAKLIPNVIIGYLSFILALAICVFWFDVHIAGSIALLLVLGFLFVICSLSIGMFISTIVKNQMQAMLLMLAFMLPSVLLSGFVFPRQAMPQVVSAIGNILPVTYFITIVRGVMLKGIGLDYIINEVIILSGFTVALLFISTLRLRKRLD